MVQRLSRQITLWQKQKGICTVLLSTFVYIVSHFHHQLFNFSRHRAALFLFLCT